jgi:hypothetical protein
MCRAVWMTAVLLVLMAAPAEAQKLEPVLARSVVVAPVTGKVTVRAAGARHSVVLAAPRSIPVGSLIDATRGKVRLVTAGTDAGKVQSGRFDGGAFVVHQARSALTDLVLATTRPEVEICGRAASSKPLPPKVVRALHGDAHGHFRTVGRFAAATVRGTKWTTEDRCDGTLNSTQRGTVETSIGGAQTFQLSAGMSLVAYCFPPGSAFHGPQFCTAVLQQPDAGIFGWAIATRVHPDATDYQLCLTDPRGRDGCVTLPLGPPDPTGARFGELVCQQGRIGGPGVYSARWFVAGQQVGVPLSFTLTLPKPAQAGQPCLQRPQS